MFRYPKMPSAAGAKLGKCVAFEKLDGTNLHWEWHRDRGWTTFGTRSASYPFTPDGFADFAIRHPGLDDAPALFQATLERPLAALFTDLQPDHIYAFTEFFGANSFAGMHKAGEAKRLVLIDVFEVESGFIGPEAFADLFARLPIPRVLFRGKFTGKLTEDIRAGKYDVCEGVVIKGGRGGTDVWMAKVKSNAYLVRLKAAFGANWEEYWE